MLKSLYVKNYVLIDSLEMDFPSSMIAITGETGSGKSIILGALSLLLGGKGDKESVRQGASSSEITGVFSADTPSIISFLRDHDIEEDDEIILRRIIKDNGRSSFLLNGVPLVKKDQEELGLLLCDFSSQNSHLSLMREENLRDLLDKASKDQDLLEKYQEAYSKYIELKNEEESLKELLEKEKESLDYAEFALKELDNAKLIEGEDEELERDIKRISESEFLKECSFDSSRLLDEANSKILEAYSLIERAEKKDDTLSTLKDRCESLQIESEDIKEEIQSYLKNISFSEYELEEKNERLSELQRIKRKYGGSIEKAIDKREAFRSQIERSEDGSATLDSIRRKKEEAYKEAERLSSLLTEERKKGSLWLKEKIEENLHALGMESAYFEIRLEPLEEMARYGKERVHFMICPNKGEKMNDIQDIASGGELSRIMLSIKAAMDVERDVETLIFDEIDQGIGGRVAKNVADMLKKLSINHQVIVITHLAQIASKAESHFVVTKMESEGRTISKIREVTGKEREEEIARLLSGSDSELSLRHAKSLLEV